MIAVYKQIWFQHLPVIELEHFQMFLNINVRKTRPPEIPFVYNMTQSHIARMYMHMYIIYNSIQIYIRT